MDIILKDYSRGACIKLVAKDVPMSALKGLSDQFIASVTFVAEKQDAEPRLEWSCLGPISGGIVKIDPKEYESGLYTTPAGSVIRVEPEQPADAEPPKKRGRPKKVETVEPPVEVEGASDEPGLPLETATPEQDTPAPTEVVGASEGPTAIANPVETAATDEQPEITDSELQRYSAKLAQHFGASQKVFDIAAKFVPEGAVPRPTNIRDNGQRWAFVKAAETESGVKYHG